LLRHRVIIIFTPVYFTSSSLLKRHYWCHRDYEH
jgi:hypothetical protein